MIFPSNRVRIMVATKPVDFRKGHDGLAALVKNELHKDPFTGTVFVFRSRKADRLKLIYWDGSGLVMAYKRLEEHTFTWPGIKDGLMTLGHAQFEALFAGLDWRGVRSVEARAPDAAFKQAAFGRKSEKTAPEQFDLALEDLEAAIAVVHAEDEVDSPSGRPQSKPRATNRGSLPASLRKL
jgi:transposase